MSTHQRNSAPSPFKYEPVTGREVVQIGACSPGKAYYSPSPVALACRIYIWSLAK